MDLVILWWLCLGIPLSWKKGEVLEQSTPHSWIGIMYHLSPEGAVMCLPEAFVKDLLEMITPCAR